jgi:tagatose-1,6-bisphosphate aldolase
MLQCYAVQVCTVTFQSKQQADQAYQALEAYAQFPFIWRSGQPEAKKKAALRWAGTSHIDCIAFLDGRCCFQSSINEGRGLRLDEVR